MSHDREPNHDCCGIEGVPRWVNVVRYVLLWLAMIVFILAVGACNVAFGATPREFYPRRLPVFHSFQVPDSRTVVMWWEDMCAMRNEAFDVCTESIQSPAAARVRARR